ncbi:hypothetical protein Pyn_24565 [Prunus yedoensis var. nudiflora]|uniref:Uncharacterized protein n=1 Tax=Prunus yedoensis var. nudiflora TaxID=2094558 RepID=A0A314YGZ9_PRUYE|nr:hypothetical protein Pyn_24565 [Prunus yedoensis var. nudiflora]
MAGGSDSLKERVTRIENFLGIVFGDETESVVTQMGDLSAKIAEIEKILRRLKASMEKKIIDCLGDMDGLAEAIGGKLKEVETELSMMKLAMSGMTSMQGGKRHLDNKTVDKGKETKVVQDGAKGEEYKDKKAFSGCFLCQGPHRVKDCPKKQNLNAIVAKRDGGAEECSSLQSCPTEKSFGRGCVGATGVGVHGGMLKEAIENMVSNWDLNCGLEEM